MLQLRQPWTRQPQLAAKLAANYSDAVLAWLPQTPLSDGGNRYTKIWTQQGALAIDASASGVGRYSSSYTTNNRLTGVTANPATESWPGVTVVACITARAISSGQFPSIAAWMPVGELFGGFNLSLERDGNAPTPTMIYWRAGNSTTQLTPTTYGTVPASDQYSTGDAITIVAGWDGATIWMVVNRNGVITSTSNAHAPGWRNTSSLFSLLGYERPAASYRTTPHLVHGVVVLPRSLRNGAEEIARNPWQLFAPRSIWVPVSAGGSVTGTSATTNANDTSSASGTTTVVGTSATTNANDTSSASGSVGGAVTGTSATTNANDTSSASGTTTVTGTVAYSNADDTASASGWAGSVSGTAAVTNANDTAQASGTVEGGATDTHDGFWSREWAKLKKREEKKPTIAEVVEIVKESPQVMEVVRAEVVRKYPRVDYAAVRENVQLQRFIAKQLIEAAQEEDDIETLLLMA